MANNHLGMKIYLFSAVDEAELGGLPGGSTARFDFESRLIIYRNHDITLVTGVANSTILYPPNSFPPTLPPGGARAALCNIPNAEFPATE